MWLAIGTIGANRVKSGGKTGVTRTASGAISASGIIGAIGARVINDKWSWEVRLVRQAFVHWSKTIVKMVEISQLASISGRYYLIDWV